MTDFPDFTKLDLGTPHAKAAAPKKVRPVSSTKSSKNLV